MKQGFDILIHRAQIIDGTGADSYKADVGISNGKIIQIGDLEGCQAQKVINAEGLLLTPGFIDVHSHADCTLLMYPRAESCVRQGVTTVVGGNCGLSPAPIKDKWLAEFWEFDLWDKLCPSIYHLYGGQVMQPIEKARRVFHNKLGYDITWKSFGEFLHVIEKSGTSVNFVPLVGHGQIRAAVMGDDFARVSSRSEMEQMCAYVREAMDSGAFGFSSGLSYLPGVFADPSELMELAKVVQEYGGIYTTHFNRTDLKTGKGTKIKGIEEAIAIARATGIRIEISHIFNGYDMKPDAPSAIAEELTNRTLHVIDEAAKEGVEIAFDVIPNVDGGVAHMPDLAVLLHAWVKQSGNMKQFVKNLKAQDYKDAIRDFINAGKWHMLDPVSDPTWDEKITIIQCSKNAYVGRTLAEISKEKMINSLDIVFEILQEDSDTKIRQQVPELREESVKLFINDARSMIGSDSFAIDDKGPYGSLKPVFAVPHPNTYGAFPQYICYYPQMRMEDTIRKITGYPAEWFGLSDRGLIHEGYQADIALLDMGTLDSGLNYTEPRKYPTGVRYVIVNGQITVNEGKHTGVLAGAVLKKQSKRSGM